MQGMQSPRVLSLRRYWEPDCRMWHLRQHDMQRPFDSSPPLYQWSCFATLPNQRKLQLPQLRKSQAELMWMHGMASSLCLENGLVLQLHHTVVTAGQAEIPQGPLSKCSRPLAHCFAKVTTIWQVWIMQGIELRRARHFTSQIHIIHITNCITWPLEAVPIQVPASVAGEDLQFWLWIS